MALDPESPRRIDVLCHVVDDAGKNREAIEELAELLVSGQKKRDQAEQEEEARLMSTMAAQSKQLMEQSQQIADLKKAVETLVRHRQRSPASRQRSPAPPRVTG